MKLSVIVPIYNVEKYLAECVDSLLGQTLADTEILLVDDGSTDLSGEIADRYAAEYPEKVRCLHVENGGQGRARNFALPLAKGEYLGFVDSDDRVVPDMYEKLCRRADETGADVVSCDFLERFEGGTENVVPGAFQEHPLSFAGSCCNKFFRSSLVGDLRFPEDRLWYEDFYFSAVMLIRAKRMAYIREPLYIYRRGQPSTMHNNNAAKNLDILRIMDMLEPELVSCGRKDDFEFLLINYWARCSSLCDKLKPKCEDFPISRGETFFSGGEDRLISSCLNQRASLGFSGSRDLRLLHGLQVKNITT